MPVAPSFTDILAQGQAEAQGRRPDLTFIEGDITLAQLHGAAAMFDAAIRFGAQSFKATFIDGAEGDELTALVDDHLNIQREEASAAQATVSIARPSNGGTEPAGTIDAGDTVATEFDANGDEVQFTLDADVVWALGELGPKSAVVTAVIEGREGNVDAAKITRFIDVSFDSTFTITNAAAAGGGNDQETDPDLRVRARAFWATLRRGTLAALEFGAKQVASVRVATATEDLATGLVTVRVTDEDGNSTAQMVADVVTELENWRCAGSVVNVVGGTKVLVDMTITIVEVRIGFNVAAFATTIAAAVSNRIKKLKAGETMFLDSIIGAVVATASDDILDVEFTTITATPGGAQPIVDLDPGVAGVVRAGTITVVGA